MSRTKSQRNTLGKIFVVFLLIGFVMPPGIPLSVLAQATSSVQQSTSSVNTSLGNTSTTPWFVTSTSTVTATDTIPTVIVTSTVPAFIIPQIFVGTSTISDLSRVDWDQTVNVSGTLATLSSAEALSSINIPPDIKDLVTMYQNDITAIDGNASLSVSEKATKKLHKRQALSHLIAQNLIDKNLLPVEYFKLQANGLIEPADRIVDINKINAVTLNAANGIGVKGVLDDQPVGTATKSVSIASPTGGAINSAQDAQAWRKYYSERLEYLQSQKNASQQTIDEAQHAQDKFEDYLLQNKYIQSPGDAISTPGISFRSVLKWLFGWLLPDKAYAYLFGSEDFESCSSLPCSFSSDSSWGSVSSTINSSSSVDGVKSLRAAVSGEGSGSLKKTGFAASDIRVQFKIKVPNPVTFGASGFFTILTLKNGSGDDRVWLNVEDYSGSPRLTLTGDVLSYTDTGVNLTAGSINTIELRVKTGSSNGNIKLWVNNYTSGSPDYDGGGSMNIGTVDLDAVVAGLVYAPESGISTTYYDDVVVNNIFVGSNSAPTAPTDLRVENQTNPIDVMNSTPRFSAIYNDSDTGDSANKYRIQVATSSSFSSPYWDSGDTAMATTTAGSKSPDLTYWGSALLPSIGYYWRTKFTDVTGAQGAWSTATSTFTLVPGSGQSTSTQNGLAYLVNHQNTDGSWGSATTSFMATAAVVDVLRAFHATGTAYTNGIAWIDSYITDNNDYLAQQAKAVAQSGGATTTIETLTYALNESTGGFAFDRGYGPDPLTTARALQALTAVGYTDPGSDPNFTIPMALYYLIQNQNFDKQWSAFEGGMSSISATGEVIDALLPYTGAGLGGIVINNDYVNSAISSLRSAQNSSGTWNDNLLDTAIAFYAMKSDSAFPTFQNSALAYLNSAQAGDGSFGNDDPYVTAKVVKALGVAPLEGGVGDPVVDDITALTSLQTGSSTSIRISITNHGDYPVHSGLLKVVADNYVIKSVDLAEENIINPSSTAQIDVNIPDTTGYVGDVKFTAFIEGVDGDAYPNSRYDETLTFSASPTGFPGLPIYFIAQKHTAENSPSINVRWAQKDDPNRYEYIILWRTAGSSTWLGYPINNTSTGAILEGFTADQHYDVTVGAYASDTVSYVYYSDYIDVITSADQAKYATSTISGSMNVAGQPLPNVALSGEGITETSDANGNFTANNVSYGATTIYTDDFRYEPYRIKLVHGGVDVSGVNVSTLSRPDTQNPTSTDLSVFGWSGGQVPNKQTVALHYTVDDDISNGVYGFVQSAKFEYYDPNDDSWHFIGTQEGPDGYIYGTWSYNWDVPGNLLGTGYELRVTVRDFSGKESIPATYGPFEIIAGNGVPTFSFTPPGAGSGSEADLSYIIKWSAHDDDNASISLTYDPDQNPSNGNSVTIATRYTDDFLTQYEWDTSGIASSTYYVRAIVSDGYNTGVVVTSPPITITHHAPTAPTNLYAEGVTNPENIFTSTTTFSAIYNDPNSTDTAAFYRIEVATSTAFGSSSVTLAWDSGKTQLATTTQGLRIPDISYAGATLATSTTYYWRIKLWNSGDHEGAWSTTTSTFSIVDVNSAPTVPTNLLTEGRSNPTNVTSSAPKFSAIYDDPNGGDRANKYHLQVSTSSLFTSLYWDSATTTIATTTAGSRSPDITYAGPTLTADTTYYWRVLFVDIWGATGAWSTATSTFLKPSTSGFQVDTNGTLTTGLVSYWNLDDASSSSRLDSSGLHDLSDTGGVGATSSGKIGGAADFGANNTNKYLSIVNNLGYTQRASSSMCGWFKSETGNGATTAFMGVGANVGYGTDLYVRYTGSATQFRRETDQNDYAYDSIDPRDGNWHFICEVYDGSTIYGNIDGRTQVAASSTATSDYGAGKTNAFTVGTAPFTNGYIFSGLADEVGFWNKALSSQEITDLWNGGSGNPFTPVSYQPYIASGTLQQYKSDGATTISEGSSTAESTVFFKALLNSSSSHNLQLQVQISTSTSFTNVMNGTSTAVAPGSYATTTISSIPAGSYYWRARALDVGTNTTSSYQEFGTPGSVDFIVSVSGFQVDTNGTLTTGLVSYWNLNDASSSSRLDSFGSNDLSDTGGVGATSSGKIGSAADFGANNTNKYLSIASNLGYTQRASSSMCGWFKSETGNGATTAYMGVGANVGYGTELYIRSSGSPETRFRRETDQNDYAYDSIDPRDGGWHFICEVYDGSTIYGNIDGRTQVAASSTATSDYGAGSTNLFTIGTFPFGTTSAYIFSGLADEVGFWNKALSSQEVTDLYNGGSGNPFTPVSYPPYIASGTLQQYKSDGTTAISEGSSTTENVVFFKGLLNSSSSHNLQLQVQISTSTSFTNVMNGTSTAVTQGNYATTTISDIPNGSYYWRARALDAVSHATSSWQEFGSPGSVDFIISHSAGFQVDTNGTLTTGLVSYWDLDDASSSTRLDLFGSNDLSDTGGVGATSSGKIGGAADFGANNTNKYLSIASNLGYTGRASSSICGWFKSETGNGVTTAFTGVGADVGYGTDLYIRYTGSATQFRRETDQNDYAADAIDPRDGSWHLICEIYDGSTIYGNIDGRTQVAASSTATSDLGAGKTNIFTVGTAPFTNSYLFSGLADEVGFWNKALSSQEVTDLYNGGSGDAFTP